MRLDWNDIKARAAKFAESWNGAQRWILYLKGANLSDLRSMPHIDQRMKKVKEFRAKSQRKSTLAIANYPDRFNVEVIPDRPFLVIPKVSSERRD